MAIPYFDAHCDTITAVMRAGENLRSNSLHLDLKRLAAYAPSAQVFAIFTRPMPVGEFERPATPQEMFDRPDAPAEVLTAMFDEALDRLLTELENNADIAKLCLNTDDIRKAGQEGKVAAIISCEGAELLGCDVKKLEEAYKRGLRLVNMSWNFPNALTGTAMSSNTSGLTEKGRDFVRRAQELGVCLDMSHASEQCFWDCIELAKKPIIASHSNSKALCGSLRNLTDEQFKALVRIGGGAGLNLCTDFLGLGRDVGAVVEHAEHFLSLGGEKALCLGGDLDGIDELPAGMTGVESWGEVYEAMLSKNWSEDLIRDIFYNNWLEIMERVL